MEETWKSFVNKEVNSLNGLVNTFTDREATHKFRVNRVNPFGYRTAPVIIDYRLFVDIERTNMDSGEVERYRDIYLGTHFRSDSRKLIPFGEEYFNETSDILVKIVGDGFIKSWEE